MKKLIKFFIIFTITLSMFSCDEETHFIKPDIKLVPVYAITDIVGTGAPFAINIYKEKALIVEYINKVNAINYTSTSYADSSTDTDYTISVSKVTAGGSVAYSISASKATGVGTLTVGGGTVYTIKVSEKEVYN